MNNYTTGRSTIIQAPQLHYGNSRDKAILNAGHDLITISHYHFHSMAICNENNNDMDNL